ncbi:hypothetical protein Scep_019149 [Stephania cephalantha]|uniref:Uncharacterized protein n=1 Tax=Stephania cephalantha TaxID=152367 RepID=A0AAP0IAK4_9MAGN
MTPLLGPPVSGKTTLLLALFGKLDKDLKGGLLTMVMEWKSLCHRGPQAYISRHDLHIGEMMQGDLGLLSQEFKELGDVVGALKKREISKYKTDPDLDVFMKMSGGILIQAHLGSGNEIFLRARGNMIRTNAPSDIA